MKDPSEMSKMKYSKVVNQCIMVVISSLYQFFGGHFLLIVHERNNIEGSIWSCLHPVSFLPFLIFSCLSYLIILLAEVDSCHSKLYRIVLLLIIDRENVMFN